MDFNTGSGSGRPGNESRPLSAEKLMDNLQVVLREDRWVA
jgi:hypothetical protein